MSSESKHESHDQTLDGKPFQTVGAATEKARAASAVCVRGTVNSGASEDRSNLVGGRSCTVADLPGMVETMRAVS